MVYLVFVFTDETEGGLESHADDEDSEDMFWSALNAIISCLLRVVPERAVTRQTSPKLNTSTHLLCKLLCWVLIT